MPPPAPPPQQQFHGPPPQQPPSGVLAIVLASFTLLIAVGELLASGGLLVAGLDAGDGFDGIALFLLGVLGGPGLVSAALAVGALVARRRPLGLLLSSLGLFVAVSPPILFVVVLALIDTNTY